MQEILLFFWEKLFSFLCTGGASRVFWPQMALAYRLDAISQGLKTLEFQGPTPSHLPSNGYARIQNIMNGAV